MGCSTPGSSVLHYLLEFPQIHAHWVSDAVISDSAARFSSCPQSFWEWESFPISRLFTSGSQSIAASASASVLLVNIKSQFPLGLRSLILLSKGLSGIQHHNSKASVLRGSDNKISKRKKYERVLSLIQQTCTQCCQSQAQCRLCLQQLIRQQDLVLVGLTWGRRKCGGKNEQINVTRWWFLILRK